MSAPQKTPVKYDISQMTRRNEIDTYVVEIYSKHRPPKNRGKEKHVINQGN